MRYVIGIAFVGILAALALAGVFMMRGDKGKGGNMMRALAVRVALSILLFAFILLSWWLGWIQPTGVPLGR
jgi:hypothetical protein